MVLALVLHIARKERGPNVKGCNTMIESVRFIRPS